MNYGRVIAKELVSRYYEVLAECEQFESQVCYNEVNSIVKLYCEQGEIVMTFRHTSRSLYNVTEST